VHQILEFADHLKNKTSKPELITEPVPETQTGPVTEIVGSNFYEFVT